MTCNDRAELLLLLAAGALDEPAQAELQAHLDSGCPRCAGAWVEAQATLAQLALDLPPVVPSSDVRERLMARVADDVSREGATGASSAPIPLRPRRASAAAWFGWRPALAAGLAALVTYFAVTITLNDRHAATQGVIAQQQDEISDLRATLAESGDLSTRQAALQQTIDTQRTVIARLETEVADALRQLAEQAPQDDRLVARYRDQIGRNESEIARLRGEVLDARRLASTLGSPDVQVVTLAGSGPGADAAGRIFWDRASGVWHFYASGLPDSAPGRTYALWFITGSERKIPAGLFDVDAQGNASAVIRVPRSIGAISLAAVTDEPVGGMPQPTGAIHLAGRVPPPGQDS